MSIGNDESRSAGTEAAFYANNVSQLRGKYASKNRKGKSTPHS